MAKEWVDDPEARYWEGVGFEVYRDENGKLIAKNKWGFLRRAFDALAVARKEPLVDLRKKNRATYPGKGATDDQWRRFALDKYDVPGTVVKVPQIGKGKRRGLDILNLIRGDSVEYSWLCGCKQVGGKYIPCGISSCDVNPH